MVMKENLKKRWTELMFFDIIIIVYTNRNEVG